MSREVMAEPGALRNRLAADEGFRAIVSTGVSDKGFCTGADISASEEPSAMVDHSLLKADICPRPIIAAFLERRQPDYG